MSSATDDPLLPPTTQLLVITCAASIADASTVEEATTHLPMPRATTTERYAIVVRVLGASSTCYWGSVSSARVLQSCKVWPVEKEQLRHQVVVRKRDCVLDFVDTPTLPVVYRGPAVFPTASVSLDDVRDLLNARLEQYRAPDDRCLVRTDEELRRDRLSYAIGVAAVARNLQHDLRAFAPPDRAATKWLAGEMGIAMHRFRVAHVPQLLAGWRDVGAPTIEHASADATAAATPPPEPYCYGTGGLSFFDAPVWMMGAPRNGALTTLVGGVLVAPMHLWTRATLLHLEQQHVSNARDTYRSFADHAELDDLMRRFVAIVQRMALADEDVMEAHRPKAKRDRTKLTDGTPIARITTFEDMERVMPACMRDLSARALVPAAPHLKHTARTIFYEFMLVQGFDPDLLSDAVVAKFDGHAAYDTRKLRTAIKSVDAYVHGSKFSGKGWGCGTLQREGFCPHLPKSGDQSAARIACHSNQLALAHAHTDPDGAKWSIGFPWRFSQKLVRMAQASSDAAAAASSSMDTS